ncbi:UDP-3-O-[3-hydroxymyristoyl] glucosamine N-acyltransferase [Rubellimicrobium thermophilum DSM 16684]|uniref:UDP-3-O-acylglucosamine N-acyltransferase n=1 Tax=Rubellimicrobium thermophilum DSM 16684 TaxID=1123069 RepID=S9S7M5_9RHOB|nr:UDP-3-O-(3-hydroxymyristoyl)glucosamine N-acyltransferase [Rubellimicrobium thermophilum]EPX86185.1 UDP-3-O-[3-hydroxymyristoyl] glucosamine N-acyltransferase [Rubellimicrobium thermophilum DSM 16684]
MLTIARIAEALGARAEGDLSLSVRGAAEPGSASPDELAIAIAPDWAGDLARGRARAALLWPEADWQALGLDAAIFVPRGRLAMARLTALLDEPALPPGIHPSAVIDPGAELAEDVAIGAFTVVGAGAVIGPGTRIGPHVTIAPGVRIGAGGQIHAGVRIGRRVTIGRSVIIHPNAVIGADGFSFVTAAPSHVELARSRMAEGEIPALEDPTWHRIHSLGGVEIGDDVEIGAGSTVDAGTIRPTRIGDGTKIDNLVMVAHNVVVGRHCLLCGQSGVAGSSVLGDRVVLGGKAGVGDNLVVGDDVVITGASAIHSNVPRGRVMMGNPATRIDLHVESYKALRRLPRLLREWSAGVPKGRGAD